MSPAQTQTVVRRDHRRAVALLATGHPIDAVATRLGWPASAVRALINGQKGWLIDAGGRVYDPGRPGNKVRLPEGFELADLEWAAGLKGATPSAGPITFHTVKPATVKPSAAAPPAAPPAASGSPATMTASATATPRPVGRGRAHTVSGGEAVEGALIAELPIDRIHPNPANVREQLGELDELAVSIAAHGLLQHLTVRPHPERPGHFELLAGHRRHAAALQAGLTAVPATIRYDVDDTTAIEVMLVENVQRTGLNPMEKAEALGRLRDRGYSGALIATRTGINESTVSYLLALLELDAVSRDRVRAGEITAGEAVAAVRQMRKTRRAKHGGTVQAWSWEPDYLSGSHPLAKKAARMCQAREHTTRRRIGKIACGQCWETVIRADERLVVAATAEPVGAPEGEAR